jgi:hypothetical protein
VWIGLASVWVGCIHGGVAITERCLAPQPPREVVVTDLLARWAKRFNALLIPDRCIVGTTIRWVTDPDAVSWEITKTILDFHDVVIVEDQPVPGGPWLIRAHARSNCGGTGTCTPLFSPELVTGVFPIQYGAGQQIFATIRGLITRDVARVGNILFTQGPDVLVIVDLPENMRYYRRVIAAAENARGGRWTSPPRPPKRTPRG